MWLGFIVILFLLRRTTPALEHGLFPAAPAVTAPSPEHTAQAGNGGSQRSERTAAARGAPSEVNATIPSSLSHFEATETAPAALAPGPLPACCSCAPHGFPAGPARRFLRRLSLPRRFPALSGAAAAGSPEPRRGNRSHPEPTGQTDPSRRKKR